MKRIVALLLALMLGLGAFAAVAEEYPSKTVEATVPWSAGGGADIVFRALAKVFPKYANDQQMVIKNVAGASGVTGVVEFLLNASKDGYNILHWSNAHVSKTHMTKVDYDAYSFDMVAQICESANYLLVPADSKWNTLQEFVDDARANPGMISLADAGVGGGNNIAAELFAEAIGAEFNLIHYAGGADEVTALLSGEVEAAICNTPEGMTNVDAGQLKILVSFASKPFENYPDVPLAINSGIEEIKDLVIEQWRGVVVQKGTDPAIIEKLAGILEQCVTDEEFVNALKEQQVVARFRGTEDFAAFNEAEDKRFENMIKTKGLGDRY